MKLQRYLFIFIITSSIVLVGCKAKNASPAPVSGYLEDGLPDAKWFDNDFSSEKQCLILIRAALANSSPIESLAAPSFDFVSSISHIAVTLFHEGQKPIRWIARRDTSLKTLNRIVYKLREHSRFSSFEVGKPDKCRIMLEIITKERPLDIIKLSQTSLDNNRFEPGITGFRLRYKGQSHFYMPTDAVVNSHLNIRHTFNHISKRLGIAKETNKISERIEKLLSRDIEWFTIYSVAFVTYGEGIIPLYRGYPYPMTFSSNIIKDIAKRSVDWIYENMREDGRFLYYYDGVKDTIIDHTHLTRTIENNYYNILRHSGGVITLLRMFEMTGEKKYLKAADKALEFLVGTMRQHEYNGQDAYYVFYNEKAKLGGSGIGLAAFLRYRQLTDDSKYDKYIHGLANHLLSRVTDDGEMIGYYIHPAFNKGNPMVSPAEEEKKALFSFYYPGEALLGLALYDQQMDLAVKKREQVRSMSKMALDFLVNIRPTKYADLFKSLPADGWLMQAIEEWADVEEFRKKEYLDFVFSDAKQMISHMYNDENSLYRDYPGTFYYYYGDHGYIDGARAEGLIAAYYLASKIGENDLAKYFLDNCKTVAESLMYSYNSEESTYMHKYPHKSIGAFRFKFTRHWVRVDSIQHAACFYVRLLSALGRLAEIPDSSQFDVGSNSKRDEEKKYTLFAAGDTMIARWSHYYVYEKGPDWPLEDVKEIISNADIAMTNLECVVSTKGDFFDKGEKRPYLYRARPEVLDILTSVGFDLVVTANNHAMDYGPDALVEQMELLEAVGISQVGSGRNIDEACSPTFIKVGDIIIAFIGLETNFPVMSATHTRPGICHAMGEKAILKKLGAIVLEAKKYADLVVFTPHWGYNWTENPTPTRVNLAHSIIDLGVDAILGHSSHQIHGIEIYKDKPIIYDMGSFLFDRVRQKRMRLSAGFLLEFDRNGFTKLSVYPLILRPSQTFLAEGKQIQTINNLIEELTSELDPNIKFQKTDGILTISMNPGNPILSNSKRPKKLYDTNRTTLLSPQLRDKKTNVVLQQPPDWLKDFETVQLQHGVAVLGSRVPKAVRPGRAFAMEVALSVSGPISGQWVAYVKGVSRSDSSSSFIWMHPIADGGWLTYLWQEGQIVLDRTLVRMPVVSEGVYDLYWGLKDHKGKTWLKSLSTLDLPDENYVHVGKILITNNNAPAGMSDLSDYEGL